MKRYFLAIILFFSILLSYAQSKTEFTIRVKNGASGQVIFNGEHKLDANGEMKISLIEDKGRFANLFISKDDRYSSYLIFIPTDGKIDIQIDRDNQKSPIKITGVTKKVNKFLSDYNRYVSTDYDMLIGYDIDTFIGYYDNINNLLRAQLESLSKSFAPASNELLKFNIYLYTATDIYNNSLKRKEINDVNLEKWSNFYKKASTLIDFNDERYLATNMFGDVLDKHIDNNMKFKGEKDYFIERLEFIDSFIKNENIRNNAKYHFLSSSFSTNEPIQIKQAIEKFEGTNKEQLLKNLNSRKRYYPGDAVPSLTYHDLEGKEVTLEQFKGKNIVLYFWTTWCGPCKKEAPYWEQLVADYKGKNVVFITVSIDNSRQILVDYMKKNKKSGVILHLDGGKDPYITHTVFGIGGVPYFAMIDTQGKYVRVAAPRPSSKIFRVTLDDMLKDEIYDNFNQQKDSLQELNSRYNKLHNEFKGKDEAKSDEYSALSNSAFTQMRTLVISYLKQYGYQESTRKIVDENKFMFDIDYHSSKELAELVNSFDLFDIKLKTTINDTYKKLSEKYLVGQKASNFILRDMSGKIIQLSSLKGKTVWLNFWSSWCSPCRAKNRQMVARYDELKKKGIVIISISLDDSEELWREAISKDGVRWISVRDKDGFKNSKIKDTYKVTSLPTTFLIDGKGVIIAQNPTIDEVLARANK